MRFGSENSSQLELKLIVQRNGTGSTADHNPLQDRTFLRANLNCAKNCPTCDQGLTVFLFTIPVLWIHLVLSPSLPCFLFLFLPASICFVSSHSAFETSSFETTVWPERSVSMCRVFGDWEILSQELPVAETAISFASRRRGNSSDSLSGRYFI